MLTAVVQMARDDTKAATDQDLQTSLRKKSEIKIEQKPATTMNHRFKKRMTQMG
jgi:hypothetical protein